MRALSPTTANPYATFHASLLALQSTIDAILAALTRPPRLINQINVSKRTVERNFSSLSRSTRWPLGLLDDTRQRLNEEREERMRASQAEVDNLSRELRYTQQTVAMELAGWQDMHERMGRRAIRELARGMVVIEKMRLEGMRRALRKLREVPVGSAGIPHKSGAHVGSDDAAGFSTLSPPIGLAGLEMANQKANADVPTRSETEGSSTAAAATTSGANPTVQTAGNMEAAVVPGQLHSVTGEEEETGSASEQVT